MPPLARSLQLQLQVGNDSQTTSFDDRFVSDLDDTLDDVATWINMN